MSKYSTTNTSSVWRSRPRTPTEQCTSGCCATATRSTTYIHNPIPTRLHPIGVSSDDVHSRSDVAHRQTHPSDLPVTGRVTLADPVSRVSGSLRLIPMQLPMVVLVVVVIADDSISFGCGAAAPQMICFVSRLIDDLFPSFARLYSRPEIFTVRLNSSALA